MCVSSVCFVFFVLWHLFFEIFGPSLSLFGESEKARSQKKKPHAACETTTTEKKRVRSMREIIKIKRAEALKICAHSRVEGIFGSLSKYFYKNTRSRSRKTTTTVYSSSPSSSSS